MSLFISKENQTLLYDMIHKTPEINTAFSSIEQKNEWFRNIIQNHYQSLPPNLTRELLLATNRQVLAYMVSSLRERVKSASNTAKVQYTPIYDNPKPKAIDFSEKIEDEVITNMAELIEQQKRMRERELQEYTPPPPATPEKVNILEDLPKNVLQPTDLHLSTIKPHPSVTVMNGVKDRHVRFEENSQLEERLSRIETKIEDLIRLFREHHQPSSENVIKENISILKQMIHEKDS
jgi:hypothetical protein